MQSLFSDFYNYVKYFLRSVTVYLVHFIQQSTKETKAHFPSHLRWFCILYLKIFFPTTFFTRTCPFPSLSPFEQIAPELKYACADQRITDFSKTASTLTLFPFRKVSPHMQPFASRGNVWPKLLSYLYQQDTHHSCTHNQYAPFCLSEREEGLEKLVWFKCKGIKAGLCRG